MAHPATSSRLPRPPSFPSLYFPSDSAPSVTTLRSSSSLHNGHRTADTGPCLSHSYQLVTVRVLLERCIDRLRTLIIRAPLQGNSCALAGLRDSASASSRRAGFRSLPKNHCYARLLQTMSFTRSPMFSGSPQKKHPLPLGAVPLAFGRPRMKRAHGDSKHVPQPDSTHRLPRQGCGDTPNSKRDRLHDSVRRNEQPLEEWHRCVAWGKLSAWTGTLLKGAHVHIAGQLRSREYDKKLKSDRNDVTVKVRVWDVRVDQVLHLNRTRQADAEEAGAGAPPPGGAANDNIPF